jgi:hypothetical protein
MNIFLENPKDVIIGAKEKRVFITQSARVVNTTTYFEVKISAIDSVLDLPIICIIAVGTNLDLAVNDKCNECVDLLTSEAQALECIVTSGCVCAQNSQRFAVPVEKVIDSESKEKKVKKKK